MSNSLGLASAGRSPVTHVATLRTAGYALPGRPRNSRSESPHKDCVRSSSQAPTHGPETIRREDHVDLACTRHYRGAGLLGGLVNAILTEDGFKLPQYVLGEIWRPGFFENVLVGVVAAVASWGLYGPAAGYVLYPPSANTGPYTVTLTRFFAALIIAIGGARWLTNEVDKKLLRAAATSAAAVADSGRADDIASRRLLKLLRLREECTARGLSR
jgi:hypothetical protein